MTYVYRKIYCCLILGLLSLLVVGCGATNGRTNTSENTVIGSKYVVQKLVEVNPFHSVQIDNYDVILVQDTSYYVRISGEDNIIDEIKFVSENGVITAHVNPLTNLKPRKKIEIYVHFVDISEVNTEKAHYESLGSITLDSLQITSRTTEYSLEVDVDYLRVDLSGRSLDRGVLFATGTADSCDVSLTGNGSFESPNLHGQNCQIIFQETSLYRIKKDHWVETNVPSSSNRLRKIGNVLANVFAFTF
jgi:hypothetical protein